MKGLFLAPHCAKIKHYMPNEGNLETVHPRLHSIRSPIPGRTSVVGARGQRTVVEPGRILPVRNFPPRLMKDDP